MKEINWKSLSLSLIISTILHGFALAILFIQYMNSISYLFDQTLSLVNNSNISVTFACGKPLVPFWAWIVIFLISYICVTMILYYFIDFRYQRKKERDS